MSKQKEYEKQFQGIELLPKASRAEQRIAQRILTAMSPHGLTESKIVDLVEGKKSTITSTLRKLVSIGLIKRHGDGVRSCPFVYFKVIEEREWI